VDWLSIRHDDGVGGVTDDPPGDRLAKQQRVTKNPTKVACIFALIFGAWAIAFWAYKPSASSLTFADPASATSQSPGPRLHADAGTPTLTNSSSAFILKPPAPLKDPAPSTIPTSTPTPTPPPVAIQSPAPTRPQLIPPEFTDYTVQRGDTGFEGISRRIFGTSKFADAISRANPLASPHKLRVGQTLRIPKDPANIQGRIEPARTTVPTATNAPAPTHQTTTGATPRVHTVSPGETLSEISRHYYGTAGKWKKILAANPSVLTRAERIKPGMELVIPEQ